MKRATIGTLVGLAGALLGTLCLAAADANSGWFLFSRHGECSSIGVLNRKLPDVGDANSPDEVARRLRRRGETVELTERPASDGGMVVMKLPKRGMSLMFVTAALCDAGPEPARPAQ